MARTKVHGEYLDPSVISAQTEVTAVGSDHMLIFDATDNALKKALLSDLIETVGSTPTFTSLTVDDITINGSTISDGGDLTIDVGGILNLDADNGGNINFKDGGTHYGTHQNENGDYRIISIVQDKDIILRGNDGGTFFNALTLDMSDAGAATFNNSVTANKLTILAADGVRPNDYVASFKNQEATNSQSFGVSINAGSTSSDIALNITDHDASNTLFRILGNGNTGIGTSSPNTTLTLSDGTDEFDFGVTTNQLLIKSVTSDGSDDQRIIIDAGSGGLSSTRGAYIALSGNEASSEAGHAIYQMGNVTGSSHVFRKAGGTDAVTIDSSGNLLVGTTNTNPVANNVTGHKTYADGVQHHSAASQTVLYVNRKTSNGAINEWRYDGATVGELGSYSSVVSYLVLDPRTNGTGIVGLTNEIAPTNESGNPVDGTKDLGDSARRWKDLYLSGGAYLGGTGAANKLDDYEEGTWTGTVSSSTATTVTWGVGNYTKIGNMVYASFRVAVSEQTIGNNYIILYGPFAQHTGATDWIGYCNNYDSGNRESGIIINNSSGNTNEWFVGWQSTSASSKNIRGLIIYQTS